MIGIARQSHRTLVGLGLVLMLALPSASAHGYQESSVPPPNGRLLEPPTQVVIRMTEPVEVGQTTVRVLDAEGNDLASGPLTSADGSAQSSELVQGVAIPGNGTYTVTWKTLWVSDGHITDGAFAFAVGNASLEGALEGVSNANAAWPGAAESTGRALGFAGWLLATGAFAFPALVADRALQRHPATATTGVAATRRRTALVGVLGAALALVGAALSLADQSARTGYGWTGILTLAQATSIGRVLLARLVLAVALLALAASVLRARRGHLVAAFVGAAGLATLTAGSHARAAQVDVPFATVPDYAHLLAAAAWVGTLAALVATLPAIPRLLPHGERARVIGPLAGNVSLVATVSVALLVATGTFAGIVHLSAWSDLWTTLYGRVLSFKLLLVAVLLAMGFMNRQAYVPRYQKAQGALPEGRFGIGRFRGMIAVEVAIMLVVIGATGALAGISPNEESIAAPQAQTWEAEGRDVDGLLTMTSPTTGINPVELVLTLKDAGPVTDVKHVTLQLSSFDVEGVPPVESVLEETTPGTFVGNVTFGFTGDWAVVAKVQRETAYDDTVTFFVTIPTSEAPS